MAADGELAALPADQRLKAVEKQYGKRLLIPMGHGEPLLDNHFKGELEDGRTFVYCPMGFLLSWHPEDFNHGYCPWCKSFFGSEL